MNAPNFASILDESPTEISRPKPLPVGTYLCVVQPSEEGKSQRQGTPYVRFPLRPVAALDDVSEEDLELAGGLEGKLLRIDYWLTPDAIYRLDEFHEHCGIDISTPVSRRVRNSEAVNSQVLAVVRHRADNNDDTKIYTDVARTAAAD